MLWSFMLETDSGLVLPTECPLVAEVQYVHSQSTSLRLVSFFIRLPMYTEQGRAHGSPQKHSPDLKKNTNTDTHMPVKSPSFIYSHTSWRSGSLSLPMLSFCPLIVTFMSCFLQSCLTMTILNFSHTTSHYLYILFKFLIPFFLKS